MKRTLAVLLLLALALGLGACSGDDAGSGGKTAPTAEPEATPTPVPTLAPTATPFPRVEVSQYVMQWKTDTSRGINYMIPTHWFLAEKGDRYLIYLEPTPEGENGFRLSLANKKKSTEPDAGVMRTELKKLVTQMETAYKDFYSDGKISRDVSLVKFKGYSSFYTYKDEYGVSMKGFVIIATYNRRIYMMNFSGPEARFEEMLPIGQKILESISRTT